MDLLNAYGPSIAILFVVFLEAVAVCWCYGVSRQVNTYPISSSARVTLICLFVQVLKRRETHDWQKTWGVLANMLDFHQPCILVCKCAESNS